MSPHSSGNTKNLHKIMGVDNERQNHVMGMGADGIYRYETMGDECTPRYASDEAEIARLGLGPSGPKGHANNKQWPKKKKGNKKTYNTPHVHDASKHCNFCHRPGHDETTCRTKEGFSMEQKTKRTQDKPRPGVNATEAVGEGGVQNVTQTLNSMLMS
jgi:hypothetical protein